MPSDSPITWEALAAIVAALVAVGSGGWALLGALKKEFENTRRDSTAGRQRLYERMDAVLKEVRDSFIHRDVYHADMRRLDEALDERDRQINDLSGRINNGCPVGSASQGKS
ncbi:MAG TPA: hypothetical protein VK558_07615 [Patescibacteria group bacterium]|nr:hypothetical protein [Patescibacteria group bacterium]